MNALRSEMAVNVPGQREAAGRTRGLTCGFARGQGRGRTADLPLFRRTLVPTELPARAVSTLPEQYPVRAVRPPSSSGPGPRPFTAVARVRIPLGVHVSRLGGVVAGRLESRRFTPPQGGLE